MMQLTENIELAAADKVTLPEAHRERWQPIRGGLLNLYLYDYEEFHYEHGHLILRGNNGTGKSRIMALQLPFLLDGQVASHRVEPDADRAKRMEWNLLMGQHNERTGYTWIEFGRRDEDGEQHFITLGCGLSATKGGGLRDPWFFITAQRVGQDLFLQSDAGHALGRPALEEVIGSHGSVYTRSGRYRQAVDEKLFRLGTQRYEAMVDLLIKLRQPQLSRNLDEKVLARVLGESLPPPSENMIADVAESFRGLESDRLELDRFRSARDGVDSFLKTYRRYASMAARRRAADVRRTHNAYETASRALRRTEEEHEQAKQSLTIATEQLRSLEQQIETTASRIDALKADPKMRSAESLLEAKHNLDQSKVDAREATGELEQAAKRLDDRKQLLDKAKLENDQQEKTSRQVLSQARKEAVACDLGTQHDAAFVEGDPRRLAAGGDALWKDAEQQTATAISHKQKAHDRIKQLNNELFEAQQALSRAKSQLESAQVALDAAIRDERAADERHRLAISDLLDAYGVWSKQLTELSLPAVDDIHDEVVQWSEDAVGTNPVSKALDVAKSDAQRQLAESTARQQRHIDSVSEELEETRSRRDALVAGYHQPPQLPHTCDESERETRDGAPFWSLVDFKSEVSPPHRAKFEAALESAGLLGAWVTPGGELLTPEMHDVVISIGSSPDAPANQALSSVLEPAADRDGSEQKSVDDSVVLSILSKIGARADAGQTWVSHEGQWQNGPLRGCWEKPAAQFIGHEARESYRRQQLAETEQEINQLEASLRQLRADIRALAVRQETIEREASDVPDDAEIRRTVATLQTAASQTVRSRQRVTEAEEVVTSERKQTEQAKQQRDNDARDLGITEWIEKLGDLQSALNSYDRTLAKLWPTIRHYAVVVEQYAEAGRICKDAEVGHKRCEEKLHDRETRAQKAAQRLATLQETIGVDVEKIFEQLAEAEGELKKFKASEKQARQDEKNATTTVARTEERITNKKNDIERESAERELACGSFAKLATLGLLEVALPEMSAEESDDWSVTRSVDVARKSESMLTSVDSDDAAWDRIQQKVHSNMQDLNTALSQHAFTSSLVTDDGLFLVHVPYQGHDRSIHELRKLLADEVDNRQLILDERERQIIEEHLIGEVAAKLHEQIHQANHLVDKMNEEIQARPMSTGMTLKFKWAPDEELSEGIVETCRRLLGATGTWSPAERQAIGTFLQQHIRDVRASREMGTWQEHLAEALDYRRWHRFWVMRKQESGWTKLTKRTHGTGSGGEKAVALTIPQFAAAAAHYSSAHEHAPRLILLDEAFVGIDKDMRGKCMDLITAFDLDFLMTSESEWGCYASLPGVAIYQLSARTGFDAVFLTRWLWNGQQKRKETNHLPSAKAPSTSSPTPSEVESPTQSSSGNGQEQGNGSR